eukprot:7380842-Prymnesium_polylepis.2
MSRTEQTSIGIASDWRCVCVTFGPLLHTFSITGCTFSHRSKPSRDAFLLFMQASGIEMRCMWLVPLYERCASRCKRREPQNHSSSVWLPVNHQSLTACAGLTTWSEPQDGSTSVELSPPVAGGPTTNTHQTAVVKARGSTTRRSKSRWANRSNLAFIIRSNAAPSAAACVAARDSEAHTEITREVTRSAVNLPSLSCCERFSLRPYARSTASASKLP